MQYILVVAQRGCHRCHRFRHLVCGLPDWIPNVLLEYNGVLLLLLDVVILCASTMMTTNRLVVPGMR